MFAFHLIKCIIVSVLLLAGSAAFVPFAPKTLSSQNPVTHFSIPKPSSSYFVVVTQQISPVTSSTALNVEPNQLSYDLAAFGVALAGLAVVLSALTVTLKISDLKMDIGADMREIKADMRKLKADMRELKVELKADIRKG